MPQNGFDQVMACAGEADCRRDPNVGDVCVPREGSVCESTECREGAYCVPDSHDHGRCAWTIALGESDRHACTQDEDCSAGLDCVEVIGGRACQIRCDSEDMVCPTAYHCDPLNGVCAPD